MVFYLFVQRTCADQTSRGPCHVNEAVVQAEPMKKAKKCAFAQCFYIGRSDPRLATRMNNDQEQMECDGSKELWFDPAKAQ